MTNLHKPHHKSNLSYKWTAYSKDTLPLWVADMDFPSPKAVVDGLKKFLNKRDYGYAFPSKTFSAAIVDWFAKKHHFYFNEINIIPVYSVVNAIEHFLNTFLNTGEAYLVFTPIYPPFLSAGKSKHLRAVELPLHETETGGFVFDAKNFKNKVEQSQKTSSPIKALLLSNPHNPIGKTWEKKELEEIYHLCRHFNLLVLSDEIWADLTYHMPFTSFLDAHPNAASLTVVANSPAKTFNMPSFHCAFFIVKDKNLKTQLEKHQQLLCPSPSLLGMMASEICYRKGEKWLERVKKKLLKNRDFVVDFLQKNLNDFHFTLPEATYLLWVKCPQKRFLKTTPYEFFLKEAKTALNDGKTFGKGYKNYVRLNFACEKKTLKTALNRINFALKTNLS